MSSRCSLVKGLSTNLISISQLCDQGFNIKFLKGRCFVTNKDETIIMTSTRSYDKGRRQKKKREDAEKRRLKLVTA